MIFQYFFVWEIGKKNGDFSILPLSKDFWRLLFIYIYHISGVFFFSKLWFTVSPSRIEKSPFWMEIFSIQTFLEAFRFEPFFWICLSFFSRAFSPFGMEKSPFRMEISPFKLFQTRYEPFFKMCFSCFFQSIFSIQNGEISILNGDFSF